MSAQVDYHDGRDAVSGELVPLVPVLDAPEHFTDGRAERHLELQAARALAIEDRTDALRDRKLAAACSVLRALVAEAEEGHGRASSQVLQAASADLIIPLLVERLREAKALIPGHVENEPARLRIDAAIAAAGL